MSNVEKILFSIVIPVYKVEKYLDKCILSILNQNYTNYELILVDDGSPDSCPDICNKYGEKDRRVKVIHQSNKGSSGARNVGVQSAIADYIIFVDSDDYWNDNNALTMLASKINKLVNVDVMVYNNIDYSCISGESVICRRSYDVRLLETANKEKTLNYLFGNNVFPGAAWVTVTRRQFLIDNEIEFIEGIKSEDVDWLLKVFLCAETYSAVNEAFYVYQKYRNDSITGTADRKSIDDILYILKIWKIRLQDKKYDYIRNAVYDYLCGYYMCAVLIYDNLKKDEKTLSKKRLQEYQIICQYSRKKTIRLCGGIPVGILSKLLNIYRSYRRF